MVKSTLCLPLAVRVPVAIILGALVWINQELDPTFAHLSPATPCEEPAGPFFENEATRGDLSLSDPRLKCNGATGIIETGVYGHYVDAADALEVSVATRADDAEVDISQWAYGGPGRDLEPARETIRSFLYRCWLKRLWKGLRDFI